jgi:hypothetical protein
LHINIDGSGTRYLALVLRVTLLYAEQKINRLVGGRRIS